MTSTNMCQERLPATVLEPHNVIVIATSSPGTRSQNMLMLLITVEGRERNVIEQLTAIQHEYCPVITPLNKVVENVQNVIGGGRAMTAEAARRLLDLLESSTTAEMPACRLTPHEARLLKLIVDGHTYKSAAETLHITQHTVGFHLRSVYEKLQVHSKSDAVGKALRQGLVR